jgi:hypothetical protein
MLSLILTCCSYPSVDLATLLGDRGNSVCAFESRVVTVADALRSISKKTGAKLSAEGVLAEEPIIIDAPNVSVLRLLRLLETVCNADWEINKDAALLRRSPKTAQYLLDQEIAARRSQLEPMLTSIARRVAQHQQPSDWSRQMLDEFLANVSGIGAPRNGEPDISSPARGLRDRLLMLLDANALARLNAGDKLVYSTSPSDLQLRFPNDVGLAVSQYIEAETTALSLFGSEYPFRTESAYDQREYQKQWDRLRASAAAARNLSKLLLGWTVGKGVVIHSVLVFDSNGKLTATNGDVFPLGPRTPPAQSRLADQVGDATITLSEDAFFHARLPRNYNEFVISKGERPAVSLRTKLADPTKFDPLSFEVAETLFGIGKELRKPVIARLPDDLFLKWRRVATTTKVKLRTFLEFARATGVVFSIQDDVVLAHPQFPLETELWRVPRVPLRDMLGRAEKAGEIEFLSWCKMHFLCEGRLTSDSALHWIAVASAVCGTGSGVGPGTGAPTVLLRALGALSPELLQSLHAGRSQSLRDVPEAPRKLLMRWVASRPAERFASAIDIPDIDLQATEVFAGGKFSDAVLALSSADTECAVLMRPSEDPGYFPEPTLIPQTAHDLAEVAGYQLASGGAKSLEAALAGYWKMGRQERWTVKLSFGNRIFWKEEIAGKSSYTGKPDGVRFSELPESFRNSIRKIAQELFGSDGSRLRLYGLRVYGEGGSLEH